TTAPDRMWAPTSAPFSRTTTDRSALTCFNLMAADRPAGPAPTITTSNSMLSRSGSSCSLISCSAYRLQPGLFSSLTTSFAKAGRLVDRQNIHPCRFLGILLDCWHQCHCPLPSHQHDQNLTI